MKIGIIGAGSMGKPIASQFAAAGHEVIIANSREPESLADFAKATGVIAGRKYDAAQQDIIVLAVRWENVEEVLADLDLSGKILVDVTNQMGGAPENRGSHKIQQLAPKAKIIKAFNTLYARYLDGTTAAGRRFLPYAGDDEEAKSTMAKLFEQLGYFPYDVGNLTRGNALMEFGATLSAQHFTVPDSQTPEQVLINEQFNPKAFDF